MDSGAVGNSGHEKALFFLMLVVDMHALQRTEASFIISFIGLLSANT